MMKLHFARALTHVGAVDRAMSMLESAAPRLSSRGLLLLESFRDLAPLRTHPGYSRLVAAIHARIDAEGAQHTP